MKTVEEGYTYDETKGHPVNGIWYKGTKVNENTLEKEEFFIKYFDSPKYPRDGMNQSDFDKKVEECVAWYKYRLNIIKALRKVTDGKGNIITPVDVFLDRPNYVIVSHFVPTTGEYAHEVSKLSDEEKILFLKTIASSMKKVHGERIVHGDLKPTIKLGEKEQEGNIIVSRSKGSGKRVAKLIDFDGSYFSGKPPKPEETEGTEAYWSPELAFYKLTEGVNPEKITCKSDIFALGIIFHEYCSGRKPEYGEYAHAYQAVTLEREENKKIIKVDPDIKPAFMRPLIEKMLKYDYANRPDCGEILAYLDNPPTPPALELDESTDLESLEELILFNITTKTSNGKGGCATVDDQVSVNVECGKSITFNAIPDPGFIFDHWNIEGKNVNDTKYTWTVQGNTSATAFFKEVTEPLNEWPKIEETRNSKRVKVHFKDGHTEVCDTDLAKSKGWI